MKIFEILNKNYDELTEKDKKILEYTTMGLVGLGGFGAGLLVGDCIGRKANLTSYKKVVSIATKKGYERGATDGIYGTMYYMHEYNPTEFKEVMKTAQDKGFHGIYNLGMKTLDAPKGLFEN